MDTGQRVRITKALDKGKEGEVTGTHTKSVPPPILQVGGDEQPTSYCTVRLDDGHINLYPQDWVEAV